MDSKPLKLATIGISCTASHSCGKIQMIGQILLPGKALNSSSPRQQFVFSVTKPLARADTVPSVHIEELNALIVALGQGNMLNHNFPELLSVLPEL